MNINNQSIKFLFICILAAIIVEHPRVIFKLTFAQIIITNFVLKLKFKLIIGVASIPTISRTFPVKTITYVLISIVTFGTQAIFSLFSIGEITTLKLSAK